VLNWLRSPPAERQADTCGHGSRRGDDLAEAGRPEFRDKRAGDTGPILRRKAFQPPLDEGVEIVHAVQFAFLGHAITVA
jgi:class I fructose-bisphosphate aldolase